MQVPRLSEDPPEEIPFTYHCSPKKQAVRYTAESLPAHPPPNVPGRRNLRNFESRPPPTGGPPACASNMMHAETHTGVCTDMMDVPMIMDCSKQFATMPWTCLQTLKHGSRQKLHCSRGCQ